MKLYVVKKHRADQNDPDGKGFWEETGYKIFDKGNGKFSLYDSRVDTYYQAFLVEREERGEE